MRYQHKSANGLDTPNIPNQDCFPMFPATAIDCSFCSSVDVFAFPTVTLSELQETIMQKPKETPRIWLAKIQD